MGNILNEIKIDGYNSIVGGVIVSGNLNNEIIVYINGTIDSGTYDIYCNETDICKIDCQSSQACSLLRLYCDNENCFVNCQEAPDFDCPLMIGGYYNQWDITTTTTTATAGTTTISTISSTTRLSTTSITTTSNIRSESTRSVVFNNSKSVKIGTTDGKKDDGETNNSNDGESDGLMTAGWILFAVALILSIVLGVCLYVTKKKNKQTDSEEKISLGEEMNGTNQMNSLNVQSNGHNGDGPKSVGL